MTLKPGHTIPISLSHIKTFIPGLPSSQNFPNLCSQNQHAQPCTSHHDEYQHSLRWTGSVLRWVSPFGKSLRLKGKSAKVQYRKEVETRRRKPEDLLMVTPLEPRRAEGSCQAFSPALYLYPPATWHFRELEENATLLAEYALEKVEYPWLRFPKCPYPTWWPWKKTWLPLDIGSTLWKETF